MTSSLTFLPRKSKQKLKYEHGNIRFLENLAQVLNGWSLAKIFDKSAKTKQNWIRPENSDIGYYVGFWPLLSKLFSRRETRH